MEIDGPCPSHGVDDVPPRYRAFLTTLMNNAGTLRCPGNVFAVSRKPCSGFILVFAELLTLAFSCAWSASCCVVRTSCSPQHQHPDTFPKWMVLRSATCYGPSHTNDRLGCMTTHLCIEHPLATTFHQFPADVRVKRPLLRKTDTLISFSRKRK